MSTDAATMQESQDWAEAVGLGQDTMDEFLERIRMSAQWTLENHECSPRLRELLSEIVESGATPERYERWSALGEHAEELFRFTPGVLELAAELSEDIENWGSVIPPWERFPDLFGPPADVETETIEIHGEEFERTDPPQATGESRTLPVKLYHIDDLPVLYRYDGICQQGYRCPACGKWVVFDGPDAVHELSVEMKAGIGCDPDGLYVYHCAEAIVFIPEC